MKVFAGVELAPGGAARQALKDGCAVTIGNFDGVHLGHQKILNRVLERSAQLSVPSVVMTFDPHPRKALSNPAALKLITDTRMKSRIFERLDVDYLIIVSFTREFAMQSPQGFIDWWIAPARPKAVVVGYDFNFGRGGSGSFEALQKEGEKRGFTTEMIEAYRIDGVAVSSSRIRNLIEGGEVALAEKFLGRPYTVAGHVVKGHGRGRRLGFPTANIDTDAELLPCDGVYAGEVVVGGRKLPAMVNIGSNPTFDDIARSVEACILNFNEDIYNIEVEVRYRERIRSEVKFPNAQALVEQIKSDQKTIEAYFRKLG